MPIGPSWASDLAKHILESDGEGLLLIIDSLDEFTKEVPFEQTLLFLLLTRRTLSQSTILITSRPGAYTIISSSYFLLIDRFFQAFGFSSKNRDRYFRMQLKPEKLEQLNSLIHLHEEMNLLSLIPVYASLFAPLIRGTETSRHHSHAALFRAHYVLDQTSAVQDETERVVKEDDTIPPSSLHARLFVPNWRSDIHGRLPSRTHLL